MKLRMIVIEADDVSAEDVSATLQGLQHVFGAAQVRKVQESLHEPQIAERLADSQTAGAAPQLPEVTRPAAQAPNTKRAPKNWKPRLGKIPAPKVPGEQIEQPATDEGPRPVTERKFQCHGCGAEPPGDKQYIRKPRVPCSKCNGITWEEIPPKGRELDQVGK
jgi:hypothetical protein